MPDKAKKGSDERVPRITKLWPAMLKGVVEQFPRLVEEEGPRDLSEAEKAVRCIAVMNLMLRESANALGISDRFLDLVEERVRAERPRSFLRG